MQYSNDVIVENIVHGTFKMSGGGVDDEGSSHQGCWVQCDWNVCQWCDAMLTYIEGWMRLGLGRKMGVEKDLVCMNMSELMRMDRMKRECIIYDWEI